MNKLVFTCGDINGVGPELTIKTFNQIFRPSYRKIFYFAPSNVFIDAISLIQPEFDFEIKTKIDLDSMKNGKVTLIDIGKGKITPGRPTVTSGRISLRSIEASFELVKRDKGFSIVTPPVSKESFTLAGIDYQGQTEIFARLTGTVKYMMFFLSANMKAGLATIHTPIRKVPALLTKRRLIEKMTVMFNSLRRDFALPNPKVAVLGLNPHAGEHGRIGKEEIEVIKPAVEENGLSGFEGPFVPDAFFGKKIYSDYDAFLAMYHDQALIPFKLVNFNKGVNYTAGLPIIRTSPDHGTAFDIAWQKIADPSSMLESVRWSEKISKNRRKIK